MVILPISLTIGELRAKGSLTGPVSQVCRFTSTVACRLGRLHVERARLWTPDEAATVSVLHDFEEETAGREDTGRMKTHDALLAQLGDRLWVRTREVVVESLQIAGRQANLAELAAILREPGREAPAVLPLNSPGLVVGSIQITTRPQVTFQPDRLVIQNPSHWVVEDIRVGNRSQFSQAGSIPGALFVAHQSPLQFELVQTARDIVVVATYVGPDPNGEEFRATMIGHSLDDITVWNGISLPAGKPVKLHPQRRACWRIPRRVARDRSQRAASRAALSLRDEGDLVSG